MPEINARMNTGTFAAYAFGSGTESITFLYVVQEGDVTNALEAWDAPANGEISVRVMVTQIHTAHAFVLFNALFFLSRIVFP